MHHGVLGVFAVGKYLTHFFDVIPLKQIFQVGFPASNIGNNDVIDFWMMFKDFQCIDDDRFTMYFQEQFSIYW